MGVVLRQAWSESQWTVLMGYRTVSTNVRRYQTHHRWHFCSFRKTVHWCTCIVHATHPTAVALSTSILLDCVSPTTPSWTHWLQDLRSHTAAWVWAVSQKDWRNQGATGWILTMHWYSIRVKKMRFSRFPVLPISTEAEVIWGGTVKRLLIAYIIVKISAKKISKCIHICQSYSKPEVGRVFETQCMYVLQSM